MSCFNNTSTSSSSSAPKPPPPPPPPPPPSSAARPGTSSATSSREETPKSTAAISPTFNLDREYTRTLQTDSYNEIRSKIQFTSRVSAADILHPDPDVVSSALRFDCVNSASLLALLSSYFSNSERASLLCLLLLDRAKSARALYSILHDLHDLFSSSATPLALPQIDYIAARLITFAESQNPFSSGPSSSPSTAELCEIKHGFSHLYYQLDLKLRQARQRRRIFRRIKKSSGIFLIIATLAIIIASVVVATRSLVALLAMPLVVSLPLSVRLKLNSAKRRINSMKMLSPRISQLTVAAKGAYVHKNEFVTTDWWLGVLHSAFESDRELIRRAVERVGKEERCYRSLVEQLGKNYKNFAARLESLEEHLCRCIASLNGSRANLVKEISHRFHSFSSSQNP